MIKHTRTDNIFYRTPIPLISVVEKNRPIKYIGTYGYILVYILSFPLITQ